MTHTTSERIQSDKPQATVHTSNGEVVGAALFLGSEDLRELGIADADRVAYDIEDGEIQVLPE